VAEHAHRGTASAESTRATGWATADDLIAATVTVGYCVLKPDYSLPGVTLLCV
jgi:hypothetical protein